jgi:hypothetical protein
MRALAGIATATLVLVLGSGVAMPTASADQATPFTDPSAQGLIGFCDKNDQPVTSGHTLDVPFVWKAVSNVSAPKAYRGRLAKATLYAFSPIQHTNPGDWSPYRMAVSSIYSNPNLPMAASTYRDAPLDWQLGSFPPTWDGLVQLRMILTNVNVQPLVRTYPTAVIRVTGDTWTMVAGDRNPRCSEGKATSVDNIVLPTSMRPTAAPSWANNAKSSNSASASSSPASSGSTPGSTESASATPAAGSDINANAASASSNASVIPIALGLLGATILAALGVALWARRKPAVARQE